MVTERRWPSARRRKSASTSPVMGDQALLHPHPDRPHRRVAAARAGRNPATAAASPAASVVTMVTARSPGRSVRPTGSVPARLPFPMSVGGRVWLPVEVPPKSGSRAASPVAAAPSTATRLVATTPLAALGVSSMAIATDDLTTHPARLMNSVSEGSARMGRVPVARPD